MSRGLSKKTKCSVAGGQLASKTTAKPTKSKAGSKLAKCDVKKKK